MNYILARNYKYNDVFVWGKERCILDASLSMKMTTKAD